MQEKISVQPKQCEIDNSINLLEVHNVKGHQSLLQYYALAQSRKHAKALILFQP